MLSIVGQRTAGTFSVVLGLVLLSAYAAQATRPTQTIGAPTSTPVRPVVSAVATDVVVVSTQAPPTAPTPHPDSALWTPPARGKTWGCVSRGGLPDPACTPGAVDPRVNQGDLSASVCRRGYTATVRPPVDVTEKIKRDQMAAYGLQGQRLADFELDHLISLELGGAPADVANLWPEPWNGETNAHMKDAVENYLNREVLLAAPLFEHRLAALRDDGSAG